ncbi:MAG: protein-glutamate O-methyltransferase CheR [Thermodesulfobacteriota bacterium]|nr:protein-glutamate O-methyltransferase CheR [Thermodesulfobacteriota bacterium]
MELTHDEFRLFSDYIYSISGILLRESKSYLIKQRLQPIAQRVGCTSFDEFYERIRVNSLPKIEEQIINAITTNETSFFRDGHPFSAFKDHVLPWLGEKIRQRKTRDGPRRGPKVSLWSAGASTGQEPYSLAMLIGEYALDHRHLGIRREDFGLLATDISSEALSKAMGGEYTEMEMKRGLSPDRLERYFVKEGDRWVINSAIRIMVDFRQVNLIKPFSMVGGFDVILCRNVLIYFDNVVKTRMVEQFYHMLSEGGFLILGVTENLHAVPERGDAFEPIRYGKTLFYRKPSENFV